ATNRLCVAAPSPRASVMILPLHGPAARRRGEGRRHVEAIAGACDWPTLGICRIGSALGRPGWPHGRGGLCLFLRRPTEPCAADETGRRCRFLAGGGGRLRRAAQPWTAHAVDGDP